MVATSGSSWLIGEIDGRRLDRAVVAGDPLQLDIEPVAEDPLQRQQPGFGEVRVIGLERRPDRPARAAGQADQPVTQFAPASQRDMDRLAGRIFEIGRLTSRTRLP